MLSVIPIYFGSQGAITGTVAVMKQAVVETRVIPPNNFRFSHHSHGDVSGFLEEAKLANSSRCPVFSLLQRFLFRWLLRKVIYLGSFWIMNGFYTFWPCQ